MEPFGSLVRPSFTHLLLTRGREPGVKQTRIYVER
jgi:hypothetical protein